MDTQLYIIISSSILFILSEILPFIKSIRGNSMLEIVINIIKQLFKNKKVETAETTDILDEEIEPLLKSDIKQLNKLIEKLLDRLDDLRYEEYGDRSLYLSSIDGQRIELV